MEEFVHDMSNLFAQLGLPADEGSIAAFIEAHRPLDPATPLADAALWTPAQSAFLREAMLEDADWAPVIDALNARLHA